jgi:CheY-like chemotaxis protein
MPILDGYSTTHAIRTQFQDIPEVRNVPIVAMTASAIQGDKEKCQQAGMDDYLAKPVKGKLLEKMREWSPFPTSLIMLNISSGQVGD